MRPVRHSVVTPISPRWELVTSVGFYLAYMPYAPDLVRPSNTLQPSLALSAGIGF